MAHKRAAPPTQLRVNGFDALALAKLTSSGLTAEDAIQCGIEFCDEHTTRALHPSYKAIPTLKLNYIDPFTGQLMSSHPSWPPFYRLRYLKAATDIASLAAKKPRRYAQPPASGVCAYFPAIETRWKEITSDPDFPLIITEGELKAACACKHDYPTIGLGGVHNWQSQKEGIAFLPELERVNWVKRNVYLIFDSDFRSNPLICQAANKLAEQLKDRGAIPHFVPLPDLGAEGAKTGLDDFLIASKNSKEELGRLIHTQAVQLTLARPLWALNDEVIFVSDPGIVLVKKTSQKIAPEKFSHSIYANRKACERKINAEGKISLEAVSAAAKWIEWPFRAKVTRLSYRPGEDQLFLDLENDQPEWNIWTGWGCQPKKGDASLFTDLLDHLFTGSDPSDLKWFLQWLAYPLQHPGAKLATYVAFHGTTQGTGKSLIGYTMGEIYGSNFSEIKQSDFLGADNAWAEGHQFILVDDFTGSAKRQDADTMKYMTTRKKIWINIKYIPKYATHDCLNYMLTSNQSDMLYLEDGDRRGFVHKVVVDKLPKEFYRRYDEALFKGALASAVFDLLLHIDLTDFDPRAEAHYTSAKRDMIEDVRSDVETWVANLYRDPESLLHIGKVAVEGDLFTSQELLTIYSANNNDVNIKAQSFGIKLGIAGFQRTNLLRTSRGLGRYWVVRNVDKWKPLLMEHEKNHRHVPRAIISHIEALYSVDKQFKN